jgi:hypothetical protein
MGASEPYRRAPNPPLALNTMLSMSRNSLLVRLFAAQSPPWITPGADANSIHTFREIERLGGMAIAAIMMSARRFLFPQKSEVYSKVAHLRESENWAEIKYKNVLNNMSPDPKFT